MRCVIKKHLKQIFENPQHPYTRALMKAVPIADPRQRKSEKDLNFKPIPSPIFPLTYDAQPSVYDEVAPGHKVLKGNWGDFDREEAVVEAENRIREGMTVAGNKTQPLSD